MKATSVQDAFEKICATEAPLHERMAAFSEAVREFGLPFAEAYDDLVARIRSGEAGSTAPEPGEPMPEFLLPDSSGRSSASRMSSPRGRLSSASTAGIGASTAG